MANEVSSRAEIICIVSNLIVQLKKCEDDTKKIRGSLEYELSKLSGRQDFDVDKEGG